MIYFKEVYKNNFYFWLFGISMVFISYYSIYDSLVLTVPINIDAPQNDVIIDSKYSLSLIKRGLSYEFLLIPLNFAKIFILFMITQFIVFELNNLFFIKISDRKPVILFIFLIGCYFNYILFKLIFT